MGASYQGDRAVIISGLGELLPKIHKELLSIDGSTDRLAEEKSGMRLEFKMPEGIRSFKESCDGGTSSCSSQLQQAL